MKLTFALVSLLALTGALEPQDAPPPPCPMTQVVDAFHCRGDSRVLAPAELVSKKKFFKCPECGTRAKKSGKCPDCSERLEAKTSDADVCPECFLTPKPVKACQVRYHACRKCGEESLAAGHCEACDRPRRKCTSLALVRYHCDGCGRSAGEPGICGHPKCPESRSDLVPRCSKSGHFPHVAPSPSEADADDEPR